MSNTLTDLIPVLYDGLDVVSRESVGSVRAVNKNATSAMASVGQTITVPITPVSSAVDIVPGNVSPNTGSQTIGHVDMAVSKSRMVPILWNGEEQNAVALLGSITADQVAQAIRTLTNEVDTDIVAAALAGATGAAIGDGTTNKFATEADGMAELAALKKEFRDAGAGSHVKQLVLTSTQLASLEGNMPNLYRANESGTDELLRNGNIARVSGHNIFDSAHFASTDGVAFTPNAIQLLARTPYLPSQGDGAADVMNITDPVTGLTFQFALYKQYRQVHIEIGLAWGVSVIKPEHVFAFSNNT